ncbi:PAS domain-containing protein [Pseudomonas aeruginosa]
MEFAGRAGVFRKVGPSSRGERQRAAGSRSSNSPCCALQPGSSSRRVNTSMKTTRKPESPLNQAHAQLACSDEAVDDYAIHTLDSAGRIASWSAGAARLFGHDASEILGRDYASCLPARDRDAGVPQQALRQADAEGRLRPRAGGAQQRQALLGRRW